MDQEFDLVAWAEVVGIHAPADRPFHEAIDKISDSLTREVMLTLNDTLRNQGKAQASCQATPKLPLANAPSCEDHLAGTYKAVQQREEELFVKEDNAHGHRK